MNIIMSPSILFLFMLVCSCAESPSPTDLICLGGAEYVNCNNTESQRRVDLKCSTRHLPKLHQSDDCKPGCRCPISMVRNSKNECILPSECSCLFGGKEYQNGRSVRNSCNDCICNEGDWDCTKKKCPFACQMHGDGQVTTFDGTSNKIDDACPTTLVDDFCNSDDGFFAVIADGNPCCNNIDTCQRQTIIEISDLIIVLRDQDVTVQRSEKLDCSSSQTRNLHSINKFGLFKHVALSNGITILYGRNFVTILIEPSRLGDICGLCGNNNRMLDDEFTTNDGKVTSERKILNSWKKNTMCETKKSHKPLCNVKKSCKVWAESLCNIIKDTKFKECHQKVDPTKPYETCVEEACSCGKNGSYSRLCTAIAVYASRCNFAGTCVDWRNPNLCPVSCDDYNKHGETLYYEPCGTTAVKPCNNLNVYSYSVEGCYPRCDNTAPYLDENTNKCVQLSGCTCRHFNKIIAANDVFKDECGRSCTCLSGQASCTAPVVSLADGPAVTISDAPVVSLADVLHKETGAAPAKELSDGPDDNQCTTTSV